MRTAIIVPVSDGGSEARCYACDEPLAWYADDRKRNLDYLAGRLVEREKPHPSGLPRYGPQRREGHARHAHPGTAWHSHGVRGPFYVNCPGCDRGQRVDPPEG